MTGSKHNKIDKQKGQVLLLAIMLISTILTIVLANSFQSITETQITKLEEESQKALAAAEAGIEAALTQGNINDIGSLSGLEGFSGSATIQTTQSSNFITPLLQKDEQYTLYLSTPQENEQGNPDFTNLGSPYYSGDLNICFDNNVAIEITTISSTNTINHYAVNPFGETIIENASSASNDITSCPNNTFNNSYSLSSINSLKLLLVRVINNSSKIGFRGSSSLPLQGKTIVSEATSPGGATKKATLFQSYPQIPAEFFVTSF